MGSVVRVAVLGCGRIARIYHLGILARLQGVEIVAVAEHRGRGEG